MIYGYAPWNWSVGYVEEMSNLTKVAISSAKVRAAIHFKICMSLIIQNPFQLIRDASHPDPLHLVEAHFVVPPM